MLAHLLVALGLFCGVTVLVWSYTLVPLFLLICIRSLKRYVTYYRYKDEAKFNGILTIKFIEKSDKAIALVLLALMLAINVSIYTAQRREWMGEDNSNLEAKQYFVVGQVLYLYRSIITDVFHPDNFVFSPLYNFQKTILDIGSNQLPRSDGELGVWIHNWLVYPYSKKFLLPNNYVSYANKRMASPEVIELLDRSWRSIQLVATRPFADKQMYEQQFLRNFPGMAHYYTFYEGAYTGTMTASAFKLSKSMKFMKRSELLVRWLSELSEKWQNSMVASKFVSENMEVEVTRQVAIMIGMNKILLARINEKQFTCHDPLWRSYQEIRNDFTLAIDKLADRSKSHKFRYVGLNSVLAKFDWYILKKYCGIILPGDLDLSEDIGFAKAGRLSIDEYLDLRFSNLFINEMKILEAKYNGN